MLKSLALYLVLVGLPLVGLFALLDWGQSLVPPPSIGGRWALATPAELACPGLPPAGVLSIEQSGRFLRVRLGDMPFGEGRLDDGRVHARIPVEPRPASAAACDALALEVTLDADGERLVGRLGMDGCDACPPTAIEVRRIEPGE